MVRITKATTSDIIKALSSTKRLFNNNITTRKFITETNQTTHTVILKVVNTTGAGASTTIVGTPTSNACWHVYGIFFDIVFTFAPEAVIYSNGKKITRHGGNWNDYNIGSLASPRMASTACNCNGRQSLTEEFARRVTEIERRTTRCASFRTTCNVSECTCNSTATCCEYRESETLIQRALHDTSGLFHHDNPAVQNAVRISNIMYPQEDVNNARHSSAVQQTTMYRSIIERRREIGRAPLSTTCRHREPEEAANYENGAQTICYDCEPTHRLSCLCFGQNGVPDSCTTYDARRRPTIIPKTRNDIPMGIEQVEMVELQPEVYKIPEEEN